MKKGNEAGKRAQEQISGLSVLRDERRKKVAKEQK